MEDAPIIRERLWELLKLSGAANVTQFAKMLGMNRQSVDRYLNSKRIPDAPSIIQICQRMNVSADWLLGLSDIRSSSADLQAAVQYTGLPESTVERLRSFPGEMHYFKEKSAPAFSDIIESENMSKLLYDFIQYKNVLEQMKKLDDNGPIVVNAHGPRLSASVDFEVMMQDAPRLLRSVIGNDMVDICKEVEWKFFESSEQVATWTSTST